MEPLAHPLQAKPVSGTNRVRGNPPPVVRQVGLQFPVPADYPYLDAGRARMFVGVVEAFLNQPKSGQLHLGIETGKLAVKLQIHRYATALLEFGGVEPQRLKDRKSTRLNSSHVKIS